MQYRIENTPICSPLSRLATLLATLFFVNSIHLEEGIQVRNTTVVKYFKNWVRYNTSYAVYIHDYSRNAKADIVNTGPCLTFSIKLKEN
jgi:hypothetical protein